MGPPIAAAEIGGGPNPRLPQVAAACRASRRAVCEVSGGVTAAAPLPRARRLSDLCPVGCRRYWRQSPSWSRRRLPAAGSVSRDALATVREKFPHGKGAGGGGGTRLGAGCGQEGTGRWLGAVLLEAQRRPPVSAGAAARGAGKGGGAAVRRVVREGLEKLSPELRSLCVPKLRWVPRRRPPRAGPLPPPRHWGLPRLPLPPSLRSPLRRGDRGLFVLDPRRAASHSETGAAGAGSALESGDKAAPGTRWGKGPRRGPRSQGCNPLSRASVLAVCEPDSGWRRSTDGTVLSLFVLFLSSVCRQQGGEGEGQAPGVLPAAVSLGPWQAAGVTVSSPA